MRNAAALWPTRCRIDRTTADPSHPCGGADRALRASVSQHNKSNTGRLTRQEVAAALKEAHAPYGALGFDCAAAASSQRPSLETNPRL